MLKGVHPSLRNLSCWPDVVRPAEARLAGRPLLGILFFGMKMAKITMTRGIR